MWYSLKPVHLLIVYRILWPSEQVCKFDLCLWCFLVCFHVDVLVWTNDRIIRWVQSIGLREYANNLIESGVHGALISMDESFDHNSMAFALQIPTQNTTVSVLNHGVCLIELSRLKESLQHKQQSKWKPWLVNMSLSSKRNKDFSQVRERGILALRKHLSQRQNN